MGKQRNKPKQSIAPHKTKQIENQSKKFKKPKGMTSLFKIIPEGQASKDAFAALGYSSEEQQKGKEEQEIQEEIDEEEVEQFGEEEFQGEDGEDEEWQGQQEGEDQGQYDEEQQGQGDEQEQGEDQGQFQGQQGQQGDYQNAQGEDPDCDAPPLQQQQPKQQTDIGVLGLQIQQTISILGNMPKFSQGLSRKHYITQLKDLFHRYYGYNHQLIDHFMGFLNPAELVQFFEANDTQRPLSIRTNTLKTRRKQLAQALIQRGVRVDPLADWSNVGIKIYESKVPIGATPQYLAGHYMLQSASSFLPVLALDPQPGEKVLDMASAPGGKTTYIAQMMKNTGCVFANDLKKDRLRALQFNLYRLGVTNTVVTCRDGRKYGKAFPNSFDRVLLDAPCTGLGIISKDQSIKANRLQIDIYKCSHVQKELLLSAIDCAKVGGIIVYSTCSVSPLQNEQVVNFALKKRFVRIAQCDIQVGQQGLMKFNEKRFNVDLRHTRRIYPHVHNMDGFYVAKLIKTQKGKRLQQGEQNTQA